MSYEVAANFWPAPFQIQHLCQWRMAAAGHMFTIASQLNAAVVSILLFGQYHCGCVHNDAATAAEIVFFWFRR